MRGGGPQLTPRKGREKPRRKQPKKKKKKALQLTPKEKQKKRERKATNKHVKGGGLVQSLTETIHSLIPSNFPSSHSLQQNTHKISFLFPIFYPSYFTPN